MRENLSDPSARVNPPSPKASAWLRPPAPVLRRHCASSAGAHLSSRKGMKIAC